jgi:hypothetical protein
LALSNNHSLTLHDIAKNCWVGIKQQLITHQFWILIYRYSIETNEEDHQYNVDVGLSVCYTDTKPCDYSASILTNTVVDHKLCDPDAGFLNSGKDYSI